MASNDVMAAIFKVWRQIKKVPLGQSMRIYLKNIRAKFYPDDQFRIETTEPWSFLKAIVPTTTIQEEQMSSDTRSVLV